LEWDFGFDIDFILTTKLGTLTAKLSSVQHSPPYQEDNDAYLINVSLVKPQAWETFSFASRSRSPFHPAFLSTMSNLFSGM
jgi:hypothetical protein